jgi:hypothetical protein
MRSIQTTIELISSYNSGLWIWDERHNGQVGHCQKYVENLPQDRIIEVVHLGLTNLMGLARHALGPDWRPNRIADSTVFYVRDLAPARDVQT